MNKKWIFILLSILHICIFSIGVIIIYFNMEPANITERIVMTPMPDTTIVLTDAERESVEETQDFSEEEKQSEVPSETTIEESDLSESDTADVRYTFSYTKGVRNLNIRKGPSMNDEIIGKVPRNATGNFIEFINSDWALIEYNGTIGYCSTQYISLTEIP